jgi:hypothetical protein
MAYRCSLENQLAILVVLPHARILPRTASARLPCASGAPTASHRVLEELPPIPASAEKVVRLYMETMEGILGRWPKNPFADD